MECAWAATRKKGTYLRAKYYSLVGRRGKKRALVAVGHKILQMSYYILRDKVEYNELGMNYLDERKKYKIVNSCVKRLNNFGYDVVLQPAISV